MSSIKMLGFAVLAALMAMAFVGASSAAAEGTALCEHDEALCASPLTHVHETSVGKAKLLSTINVECNVLFLGDALSGGKGNPLVLYGYFTYSECNESCTVVQENGPAEIKVLKEGHEVAKITGEGLVHVKCPSVIDCSFDGVGQWGTAKGPLLSNQGNGEVIISGSTANKETGFLCPSTSKLDITTTPLSATYVTAEPSAPVPTYVTALCAEDPGNSLEEHCPAGQIITHVHETSVGKAKLLSSITVECNVLFLGDALSGGLANPLVIHGTFTYTNCGSCEVEEENGPAEIQVLKEGHETAEVTGEGLVHVNCSGFIDCSFDGKFSRGRAQGPLLASQENGEVSIKGKNTHTEAGGFLCPKTNKLDITTTPLEPIYITY